MSKVDQASVQHTNPDHNLRDLGRDLSRKEILALAENSACCPSLARLHELHRCIMAHIHIIVDQDFDFIIRYLIWLISDLNNF